MDFFGAMQSLKEGNAVRLKSWKNGEYIELSEREVKKRGKIKTEYEIVNQLDCEISPSISFSALVSSEWEIYNEEENKKLINKLSKLLKD